MPRQPRRDAPGTLHHVMVRGIERTPIFRNKPDRADFVARLAALSCLLATTRKCFRTNVPYYGGVSLGYTYDGSLLTGTTWTGPVAGSVTRTYDTDFRVATESLNGGDSVTFQYDPDSLLTTVGALTLTRHVQHGRLTGTTLGGVTDSYGYSTFGELSTYQANYSASPVLGVTYTRDALGRITQKTEAIGGTTTTTVYGYDTAGRLTDVTVDSTLTAHYEYDANGNRLSVTRPGTGTVSGTYDTQDRLTTYGAVTYSYSANGDLQTATSGSETTTYSYDVFGNLTAVTLPTGTQIEYVIDGQNRRIGKKVNGTLTQAFVYSGQLRAVAELDGSGTVVSRFVYGTKINVPEYMIKGGTTYRLVTDHLGSVRLLVDTSTGTIAQRLDYDEFGQITQDTAPGFQPFGFAGGLYDPDTKLVRFGARDYDAFTGRWTTKDPIGLAGGINLYTYVGGNPTVWIDPLGLVKHPSPTVDPLTGREVGRFPGTAEGNTMIEPKGGSTVPYPNPGGPDTHTLYPNGSNYQRLNPEGHPGDPSPHGHGHLEGTGPGKDLQGPSIDTSGKVVKPRSKAAHWPVKPRKPCLKAPGALLYLGMLLDFIDYYQMMNRPCEENPLCT